MPENQRQREKLDKNQTTSKIKQQHLEDNGISSKYKILKIETNGSPISVKIYFENKIKNKTMCTNKNPKINTKF